MTTKNPFPNPKNDATIQLKVKCRVKGTSRDSEILTFQFNLGPLRVICIANIPQEGEEEAVAYVKLELDRPKVEWEAV